MVKIRAGSANNTSRDKNVAVEELSHQLTNLMNLRWGRDAWPLVFLLRLHHFVVRNLLDR